jgi:hypothetical protein
MPQCQFLFSAIFVFQKSYTGNILEIGQNESQTSYFSRHEDGVQSRDGGGPGAGHTIGWRGSPPGLATRWCGPLGSIWHRPSTYKFPSSWKPKMNHHTSMKSSAAPPPSKMKFGGQKSLFWHPSGTGNCPRSHLHRLHRHLHHCFWLPWWWGSSSPPRLRALLVAMYSSLSPMMWSLCDHDLCNLVELVDVTLHLLCYSSGFINVISGDTLSHDVKLTVCASCVALRINLIVILSMSYDLSLMSLWIVVFVWNRLVHSRWQCGVI